MEKRRKNKVGLVLFIAFLALFGGFSSMKEFYENTGPREPFDWWPACVIVFLIVLVFLYRRARAPKT